MNIGSLLRDVFVAGGLVSFLRFPVSIVLLLYRTNCIYYSTLTTAIVRLNQSVLLRTSWLR